MERDGDRVNHKRLCRMYREAGLCLKRKKRKHCTRSGSPKIALTAANRNGRSILRMTSSLQAG